jgi:membrane associated rhomboid family serine protease
VFPLRDTIRSSTFPVVNTIIIIVNVIVFLFEMVYIANLDAFVTTFGLVPARYFVPEISQSFSPGEQLFALISFMFLHGGFLHLIGNMWFLYIFGDNIEDRLGHLRYLLFYVLCGWASAIAHIWTNPAAMIPTIGASGAVAGVMGAYMVLYPRSRILTLILIIIIPYFIEIPAVFFLAFWFIIQFVSASATDIHATGVAWWAHVGGFASGIIFAGILLLIPKTKLGESAQRATTRRSSPKFQHTRASYHSDEPHLYGTITVTPKEALYGARKLVNVPESGRYRPFFVHVPPGVRQGTVLRLAGMGKRTENDTGDIYLNVEIRGIDS